MAADIAETYEKIATRVETDPALRSRDLRAILLEIPEVRPLIIGAAIRGLGARKAFWSKQEEDWTFEPDFIAQGKAIAFLAAYVDGLPVQTTVQFNVDDKKTSKATLGETLENSPAMVAAIEKELKRIKARAPGRTLAVAGSGAPVVDLE